MLQKYQIDFIEFSIAIEALRFGEFKLKSGRISPYFFNTGLFNTGASLAKLSQFYASAIHRADIEFDVLFGPAYKGIPLAAATSVALATNFNRNTAYAFNRKEAKKHAEGGLIVGAALTGKVLIIDDVISAGTSITESVEIIRSNNATVSGVIIAVDRQERGQGQLSAIQEVEQNFDIQVHSIICLDDLIHYMEQLPTDSDTAQAVRQYQPAIENYKAEFGV